MTDNKAITQNFQAKQIPSFFLNFCDRPLQVNFILAHVTGIENPAAGKLFNLDKAPALRVQLKLSDSNPNHCIEIDMASKTPKQNENGDDFNLVDATSRDPTIITSLPENQIEVNLTMVTKRHVENDEKN